MIRDLQDICGLPLSVDAAGRLCFGSDVVVEETRQRLLSELAPVVLEPQTCEHSREPVYTMFNGVYRRADAHRIAGSGLRYELTLIPPRLIGRELIKTHGHVHNAPPGSRVTYAEVCEVLLGTAHFFFQTLDPEGPDASMAFYIEAGPGQKVVIAPDLDHLTINAGNGPLLFADVVATGIQGVYERYRMTRGAAYYEVRDGETTTFIPNPRYRRVPPLQRMEPHRFPELGLIPDRPLYQAFVEQCSDWTFLREPDRFAAAFPDLATLSPVRVQISDS